MSAVALSMKSRDVRVVFCRVLDACRSPATRATLEPAQFDLLVRLMNAAVDNESDGDPHGVAYAILDLAHTYCRVCGFSAEY